MASDVMVGVVKISGMQLQESVPLAPHDAHANVKPGTTNVFLYPAADYDTNFLPVEPGVNYALSIAPITATYTQSAVQYYTDAAGAATAIKRFEMAEGAGGGSLAVGRNGRRVKK